MAAVESALQRQAAVALLGPRQVGKTTLALALADKTPSLYLDLESRADRAKLKIGWLSWTRSIGCRSCFRPCGD